MKRQTRPKPEVYQAQESGITFVPRCPHCGAPIDLQAQVEKFGDPVNWTGFYGYQGERWQRCSGEAAGRPFIHFRCVVNGRDSHRLAWLKPEETATPEQQELL